MVAFLEAAAPRGVGKMNCPECNTVKLSEKSYRSGRLILDRCESCKGIWFDSGELEQVLRKHAEKSFDFPKLAYENKSRPCPKCNQALFEFCYPGTTVFIDMCKSCRGIWLDDNEWKEISLARLGKVTPAREPGKKMESPAKPDTSSTPETYAENIPGLKGALLRFIDKSISTLTNY